MPRHVPPGGATAGHSGPKPPCTALTQQGAACRAFALPGGGRCAVHEPLRAERVRAARAKGGQVKALRGRRARLDTVQSLVRFTGTLIQDALAGALAADVARTALYGISIQRQLVESSDLERRLAALEERLAATSGRPRGTERWAG